MYLIVELLFAPHHSQANQLTMFKNKQKWLRSQESRADYQLEDLSYGFGYM